MLSYFYPKLTCQCWNTWLYRGFVKQTCWPKCNQPTSAILVLTFPELKTLVSNLFLSPNQIAVFFENLNMCFIKTTNITVYLNTAEYENNGPVWLKEIKMLRIHFFSIFTMKTPWALGALTLLGLLIVKTLTNLL